MSPGWMRVWGLRICIFGMGTLWPCAAISAESHNRFVNILLLSKFLICLGKRSLCHLTCGEQLIGLSTCFLVEMNYLLNPLNPKIATLAGKQ